MRFLITCICALGIGLFNLSSEVQINEPFSWPDLVFVEDGDTLYGFGGADMEPFNHEIQTFIMPFWQCFSTRDLINWQFESMLDPADTWIGSSDKCFASHAVRRNDKWYWYFSNFVKSTGVVVADSPKGPWKDVLGEPLLPEDISPTHEYDKCVFVDDDGQAYIVYGSHNKGEINYHMAELNEDMISLKTQPEKIEVTGDLSKAVHRPVDAPYLHKANGLYYLSWRMPYAVSENVKGPYRFAGNHEAQGHGSFFQFRNQWFVSYTTLKMDQDYRRRYRWGSLAYVHYNDDGSIAPMEPQIREYGVGQYEASWDRIEAEWYVGASKGVVKKQTDSGFEMRNLKSGDHLRYPNIHNCPPSPIVEFHYLAPQEEGCKITIHAFEPNGPVIGESALPSTGDSSTYAKGKIALQGTPPGTLTLVFVVSGTDDVELFRLNSFGILKSEEN